MFRLSLAIVSGILDARAGATGIRQKGISSKQLGLNMIFDTFKTSLKTVSLKIQRRQRHAVLFSQQEQNSMIAVTKVFLTILITA